MKHLKIIFATTLLAAMGYASGQESSLNSVSADLGVSTTRLVWEEKHINLGKVEAGKAVEVNFHFTNTGSDPVIIKDVRTSCGCTAAKHTDAPILPGESSDIRVIYNAAKQGVFNKSVSIVTSEDDHPVLLRISGEVI